MLTTALFTTHTVRISGKFNTPFSIVPFSDVHFGAPLHCKAEWKSFCDTYRNRDNVWFLGGGDYTELVSTSERGRLRMGKEGLHESTMQIIEDVYRDTTSKFLETVPFMKNRCIGLVEGNHYGSFQDGTTTTMRMCQALNCKYLGVISVIRVFVDIQSTRMSLDICMHHGKGGGQLAGTPFNQVAKMGDIVEADVYLMGHDHTRGCVTGQRLLPVYDHKSSKLVIRERKVLYGRTGSFLRGYVDGQVSYIADRALKPANLGWIEIQVTPRRRKDEGCYLELRGIS